VTGISTGRVRLIATDLDHTLLDEAGHVSPRTRAALGAARAAGALVVPVTARQPVGLEALAAEVDFTEWALCSNGSFGIHMTTREVLFAREAPAEMLQRLAIALNERMPGLLYASVREAGEQLIAQEGYAAVAHHSDHKRDPATLGGVPLQEVLAAPSLKLVIRHPELGPDLVFRAVAELGLAGFELTLSGAPFVEIMAEGVSKASGLARLCASLGITRDEVVAFGDGLNDMEMLAWAGHGVAVANALPELRGIADEIAPSNDDDGVATVIERLLG